MPASAGAHGICQPRYARSGCGIIARCLPVASHKPAMPCGEPLGLSGYCVVGSPAWSTYRTHAWPDFKMSGTRDSLRELDLALAVRDPDADARALHALEHDRGGVLLDADGGPPRFEASGVVVDETGLLDVDGGAQPALGGDESEERHELAPVADAQRERVGPVVKLLELVQRDSLKRMLPAQPLAESRTSA